MKVKIEAKTGTPACVQSIISGGTEFLDDRTLLDYKLVDKSTVYLAIVQSHIRP